MSPSFENDSISVEGTVTACRRARLGTGRFAPLVARLGGYASDKLGLFFQIAFCAQGTLIAQVTADAKFAEGAVIGAFDAAFKARKGSEGFGAGCVFQEDVAEAE